MTELTISSQVKVYSYDELPADVKQLVDLAKEQVTTSYSPYSHFAVGAALRMDNGEIVTGSNQENAAYPSGICAERTTIFYASAHYPTSAMKAIAVAAYTDGHFTLEPAAPCGACRQVMVEYEDKFKTPMQVILYGENRVFVLDSASDLVPFRFVGESLKGL